MADVFLSYSREDKERLGTLVNALEKEGIDVWWDPEIDPGKQWDTVIKENLLSAKSVISVWSEASVSSYWVKTEAHNARNRGVLVPISIEDVEPPFGFELIQAEDLIDWSGDREAPNFQRLVARVNALITGQEKPMPLAENHRRGPIFSTGTLLAFLAAVNFLFLFWGTIDKEEMGIATGTSFAGILFVGFGLFRQWRPWKMTVAQGSEEQKKSQFRMPIEKAFFGGLFGGTIAGLIITVSYYLVVEQNRSFMIERGLEVPSFWLVLTQITIASGLIGILLGILSYGSSKYFEHLSGQILGIRFLINSLMGGILGGIIAGLITGPFASLHFGRLVWPVLEPITMIPGALLGTGIMVFSIVNYGKEKLSKATLRKLMSVIIATIFVSAMALVAVESLEQEIKYFLSRYLINMTGRTDLIIAGLYYGAFIGIFLGAVVGFSTSVEAWYQNTKLSKDR